MPAKTVTPYDELAHVLAAAEQLRVDLTIIAGSIPPAVGEDAVIGALRHLERAIAGLQSVRDTIDAWTGSRPLVVGTITIAKRSS